MSLYNEVRPTDLSQVRGQERVVAQIRAILLNGNVPNVSLFVGPRGTGKTTVARIFSKAVNCMNPTESGPCNQCESCLAIAKDSSIDVIELDAASHNKVDDVHQIIESVAYAPLSKYKVYIIDEVHMLSTAAFNALLKLLEEPPVYCKFILCTTEEHKVPVTIKSRCRYFEFKRIQPAVIAEKMAAICKDRNVSYEEDALRIIAKRSEGCMRDAESLLEIFLDSGNVSKNSVATILGASSEEVIFSILEGVAKGNVVSILGALKETSSKGKDLSVLLKSLIEALTDTAYYIQSKDLSMLDNSDSYAEHIVAYSALTDANTCFYLIAELTDIFSVVQKGGSIDFVLEAKLVSLIGSKSKISLLEQEISSLKSTCEALTDALYSDLLPQSDNGMSVISHEPVTETETEARMEEHSRPTYENEGIEPPVGVSEYFEEMSNDPSFFTPPSDTFSELPGDVSLPEGTQVLGTISLLDEPGPAVVTTDSSVLPGFVPVEGGSPEVPFENSHVVATVEPKCADSDVSKTPSVEEPKNESKPADALDSFGMGLFADIMDIPGVKSFVN